MRIRRLKLSGFKSFVEPAELRIESGLTGVVGPNGCGKSNLLEAIRWVMGESSAKSLRGGGMEDVIFAGTATRPARSFAEVVLLADDADREELEVVRRIERGAGSAYRINGRDVRAKDVALIFADAATGAHSPALVSQGRIAAVIAAKPAERRAMLEEAAGISGLHVRRKDAEQKLRATEANLARLDDIMAALDAQIAALRRQARAADRYRSLSDRIKLAEARLIFARWRDAAAAADTARKQAETCETAANMAQNALKTAQSAQIKTAESLAEARDILADRRDDASAHGHRMATLTSQLESAEQRLKDLDRQRFRLEEDRGDADRMTSNAAESLANLERELTASKDSLASEESRRPTLANRLESDENSARTAELALAAATAQQAGVEAEWRINDAEVNAAIQRLKRIESDQFRLDQQITSFAEQDTHNAQVAAAITLRDQATAVLVQSRQAAELAQITKQSTQESRDSAASALSAAKAEITGIEREFQALQRDRDARAKQASAKHGLPSALDHIRAKSGYERALAAVLGRDAKSPLGAPESAQDGRFWTGNTATSPSPVADNLAQYVTACPPQLAARLALVHVTETDDSRTLNPGEWLVTRTGHLR
ncbi:MAG: hypothetical protein RLY97_2067, partial [Pseudomonadota bacterium]